ncbi:hypothetical protein LSAT2_006031 [Lamellibrachia satsuma]|nr:hypothetical protein LSAT2_006031 [Lamellibrachia satsuma]
MCPFPPQHNTATPQHRNTATPQHRNTATPQHRNTATPQHRNTATPQHRTVDSDSGCLEASVRTLVVMGTSCTTIGACGAFSIILKFGDDSHDLGARERYKDGVMIFEQCICAVLATFQSCHHDEFQCNATSCIDLIRRCDLYRDCENNSDEQDCETYVCPPSHFKCRNHMCIPRDLQCDYKDDCGDNSDEGATCQSWMNPCDDPTVGSWMNPCDDPTVGSWMNPCDDPTVGSWMNPCDDRTVGSWMNPCDDPTVGSWMNP